MFSCFTCLSRLLFTILKRVQYFLIFLIEISILFILSRLLTKTLSQVLFLLTKSRSVVTTIIALLFFPGVVVHELSHMFAAGILFVPVGDINLMPKLSESGELRLGSVMIGKTDILRRAIIGLAPLVVGLMIVLGIPFMLQDSSATFLFAAIAIYLLFEIGNTMFSSRKDMEGIVELVIVLGLLVVIFYVANFRWPAEAFASFISRDYSVEFFKQINVFLAWTIAIDVITITVLKLARGFIYK